MDHVAIIGGGDQANRRDNDFYPTPTECTQALINFLESRGIIFQTVHEPASGDGAISKVFEENFYEVISSDLREDNVYGTGGIDFLIASPVTADACITNPPFIVAEEFIRKAVPQYRITAMLLKSQFWHAKGRYKMFQLHTPAFILPLTWRPDFTAPFKDKKGSPTMDVIWTVWIAGYTETKYIPLLKP